MTKREDDGRYAFVAIDGDFEVDARPCDPAPGAVSELVARAEKGCFVGNSLVARPRYHWTVNGEAVT